jgi:hypothetical protein
MYCSYMYVYIYIYLLTNRQTHKTTASWTERVGVAATLKNENLCAYIVTCNLPLPLMTETEPASEILFFSKRNEMMEHV